MSQDPTIPSLRPGGATAGGSAQYLAHYKVVRELGRGGMGAVYQGYEEALHRPVAIKVLADQFSRDPQFVARFYQEAQSAAALNHPNIVQIYYIGQQDGKIFFAMEYVEGVEAAHLLKERGKLTVTDAVNIVRQTAIGLDHAQRFGIIHRDIKPSNLMITSEGVVKIADFGLAKELERDARLTDVGVMVGTPLYMAPEQARGEKVDHHADIYALGATFYHLIVGHPPYEASSTTGILMKHLEDPVPNASAENPDVPLGISAIIGRMMAKNTADRYANYKELIADLDLVLTQGLTTAAPQAAAGTAGAPAQRKIAVKKAGAIPTATPAPIQPAVPKKKFTLPQLSKPVLLGGLAAAVLLLGIAAFFFLREKKQQPTETPPTAVATEPDTGKPSSTQPTNATEGEEEDLPTAPPPAATTVAPAAVGVLADTVALDLSAALNAGRPDAALPSGGKLAVPPETRHRGEFELAAQPGAMLVALSTAAEGGWVRAEIPLPLAQQQRYKSLVVLHTAANGSGTLRLILRYADGKEDLHILHLSDWQAVAAGAASLPPQAAGLGKNTVSTPITISPAARVNLSGAVAEAASADATRPLQKIILARPLAGAPPHEKPSGFPEQDKFVAVVAAILAAPVDAAGWNAAMAEEQKFRAVAVEAEKAEAQGRIAEALAGYEKIARESPPNSYNARRAAVEVERLKVLNARAEREQAFARQWALDQQVAGILKQADDLARMFQFMGAAKKLEEEISKASDPAVKDRLKGRWEEIQRINMLHSRLVMKFARGGQMANWPLINKQWLQGIITRADDVGVWKAAQRTPWYEISRESLYKLYQGVVDETRAELLLGFAALCMEQKPTPWSGAEEYLERAEKLDPKLAAVVAEYRGRLQGTRPPSYDPRTAEISELLGRVSDAARKRRWIEAQVAFEEYQSKYANSPLNEVQRALLADLTAMLSGQMEDWMAIRQEAALLAQQQQVIVARRADFGRRFGRMVRVAPSGGDFKTMGEAAASANENFAIELASGHYPENVSLKGKKRLAIFAVPGSRAVCERFTILDDCDDIVMDGLIFAAGERDALRIGPAKDVGRVTVRNCAFLGRGIAAPEGVTLTVENCVFFKRGLNIGSAATVVARHSLFLGEAIMLPASRVTLMDNIFATSGEAWILGGEPQADFTSDYNFVQLTDPKKFARAVAGSETKATYPTLNEWQVKTKKDTRSILNPDVGFADAEKGNFRLLPSSAAQGKASDRQAVGPRWLDVQWSALQQVLQQLPASSAARK